MAHYLVTGGCGFIGSHLADALVAAGHRVRILDDLSSGKRENAPAASELLVGDVADRSTVAAAMRGIEGCFHLAAIASVERCNDDWAGTNRVNLGGTIHILEAARAAGGSGPVPVVYASSAAVYGDNPNVPLAETEPLRPLSAYGADKAGSELHARVAAQVHGVATLGLRLFNVYGPRQDPSSPYSGVISIFAQRLIAKAPIVIFGDGGQTRDFVYVRDAVGTFAAAMAALAKASAADARVYNVATGEATSIRKLAELLGELNRTPPQLSFAPPRKGDIRVSIGNGAAAAAALGVRAGTGLREGLRLTLASLGSRR